MTLFRGIGATGGTPKSMFAQPDGASYYMTFESPVGTDYVVPTGKTFKVTRILAAFGGSILSLGHGTEGIPSQAAGPAGQVILIGGNFAYPTTAVYGLDIYLEIPAGKYPYVQQGIANNWCILFGIEE